MTRLVAVTSIASLVASVWVQRFRKWAGLRQAYPIRS